MASVVPADDDRYELDLVVENLRGGRDAWDADLLISAGEVARDLAYALRLEAVRTALAPGSPLDDLDEALRAGTEWRGRRLFRPPATEENRGTTGSARVAHNYRKDICRGGLARLTPDRQDQRRWAFPNRGREPDLTDGWKRHATFDRGGIRPKRLIAFGAENLNSRSRSV